MRNAIVMKLRAFVHLPSAKTLRAIILFLALLVMEAAPTQAWLIVYAAAQLGDVNQTAAPFWLTVVVLSLFAAARWFLARFGAFAIVGSWILSAVVAVLALARFSPLMFGSESLPLFSFSWLGVLFNGDADYSGLAGLILLMGYLGWRGSSLGGPAPAFSRISRRFGIGLGALTLAIFGSLVSAPASKDYVSAALLVLLALEGFGGLTALALSHSLISGGREDALMPGAQYSVRWQVTAIAIAFVLVASVTLIGGALNLNVAHLFLSSPVVELLNRFGSWLTQSLAYLLYLISVYWLSFLIPRNIRNPSIHFPQPPKVDKNSHFTQIIPPEYGNIAAIIIGALVVVGILVFLFFLARSLLSSLNKPTEEEVEEEREDLDASSLLRQQLRDLLNRWRSGRKAAERDTLRRGGVRWLYREILRAGAQAGYERRASETADEYAERLAETLETEESGADDLRSIVRAYDDARYGATDDDPPASTEVAARTRRVTQRINALGKEPARRNR
jgi:hypothetical protein